MGVDANLNLVSSNPVREGKPDRALANSTGMDSGSSRSASYRGSPPPAASSLFRQRTL